MTDNTPRATVCPDCRTLIPATMADRSAHKEWHDDLKSKHRGVQKVLAEQSDVITRVVEDQRNLRRDVESTEIPEPVDPLVIEEWPADELDDNTTDDTDTSYEELRDELLASDATKALDSVIPAIDRDDDEAGYFTTRTTP